MKYYLNAVLYMLSFLFMAVACGQKKDTHAATVQEDKEAKQLLQGVWLNEDDESVVFKAEGDTIFYPDSVSQPVYFQIFHDTLVLHGANISKYTIVKQSAHVFRFRNASGDIVNLVKSEDRDDNTLFHDVQPLPLNQGRLIKRDSVLIYGKDRYHSYVQVNPTSYKVVKATYSDEGVEQDNVYYDNIVHVSVYQGNKRLFSKDFRKQDFAAFTPKDFLKQSILSDIELLGMDTRGVIYRATLVIPDSPSSFLVELVVGFGGKLRMDVKN